MSTQKTQHYQLHSWVPEDDFHLTEINENFAKLDGKLQEEAEGLLKQLETLSQGLNARVRVVAGRYTGDNQATNDFDLGGKPIAVILEMYGGYRQPTSPIFGGLATQEMSLGGEVTITETGFRVLGGDHPHWLNRSDRNYHYSAVFL